MTPVDVLVLALISLVGLAVFTAAVGVVSFAVLVIMVIRTPERFGRKDPRR